MAPTVTQPTRPWQNVTAASHAEVLEQVLSAGDPGRDMIVFQEEDLEQGWREEDPPHEENQRTLILQSFKGEDSPRQGFEDPPLPTLFLTRTLTT